MLDLAVSTTSRSSDLANTLHINSAHASCWSMSESFAMMPRTRGSTKAGLDVCDAMRPALQQWREAKRYTYGEDKNVRRTERLPRQRRYAIQNS